MRVLQDGGNTSVPVEEGVAVTVEEDVGQVVFELEVITGVFQFSIPVEIQTVAGSANGTLIAIRTAVCPLRVCAQ